MQHDWLKMLDTKHDSLEEWNEWLLFFIGVDTSAEDLCQFNGSNAKRPPHTLGLLLGLQVLEVHASDTDDLTDKKHSLTFRILRAAQILKQKIKINGFLEEFNSLASHQPASATDYDSFLISTMFRLLWHFKQYRRLCELNKSHSYCSSHDLQITG